MRCTCRNQIVDEGNPTIGGMTNQRPLRLVPLAFNRFKITLRQGFFRPLEPLQQIAPLDLIGESCRPPGQKDREKQADKDDGYKNKDHIK